MINSKEDHPDSKLALSVGEIKPGLNHTRPPMGAALSSYAIKVQRQEKTADASVEQMTGPVNESIGDNDASSPANKGFVSDFGSRINIVGDTGGEAIEIVHQCGAQITIRPDGSISIAAGGKLGGGIMATEGDAFLSAPSGKIIITGSDIVVESKGDLQLTAGGNMRIEARDIVTHAFGSMQTKVNGRSITSIGSDNNLTVGGAYRQTVAGDIRMQTPNKIQSDSDFVDIKTTKDFEVNATGSMMMKALKASTVSTKGELSVKSESNMYLNSSAASVWLSGATAVGIEGINGVWTKGKELVMSAKDGSITMDATTAVEVSTKDMRLSASDGFNTYSGTTLMNSEGEIKIEGSGPMDLRGSTIDLNKASPDPDSPKAIQTTSPSKAKGPDTPKGAEYPGAREIIGSMITRLDAPEFQGNAYDVPANEMASYENENQQPDQKAKNIALQNKGSGSRIEPGSEITEAFVDTQNNSTVAEETPYPGVETTIIPEMWSRHVAYFPGQTQIPLDDADKAATIIGNIQHLCYNIIDKLVGQYGAPGVSFEIIRGFSPKSGSGDTSKHTEGLAVNIRSVPQDNISTVEIAKWAASHLAFDVVRLERDEEKNVSVHIEAASAGSKGKRLVETDSDKTGNPKNGLHYIESTIKLDGR